MLDQALLMKISTVLNNQLQKFYDEWWDCESSVIVINEEEQRKHWFAIHINEMKWRSKELKEKEEIFIMILSEFNNNDDHEENVEN
jgi:hypothetical protein